MGGKGVLPFRRLPGKLEFGGHRVQVPEKISVLHKWPQNRAVQFHEMYIN